VNRKTVWLIFTCCLVTSAARSQSRRVYEGVVDMKQKPIGTLILMDVNGNYVSGWIRLGKYVPIDGGTPSETSTEFRAAGNSYTIDEKRNRITYSGTDGSGDSRVSRLTPVAGTFKELQEGGEQFGGSDIVIMEVGARLRRFHADGPSLWKRAGPPFETFRRLEELLQREITVWVADLSDNGGDIEVVEEPDGMNIPLKLPKKPKEKK